MQGGEFCTPAIHFTTSYTGPYMNLSVLLQSNPFPRACHALEIHIHGYRPRRVLRPHRCNPNLHVGTIGSGNSGWDLNPLALSSSGCSDWTRLARHVIEHGEFRRVAARGRRRNPRFYGGVHKSQCAAIKGKIEEWINCTQVSPPDLVPSGDKRVRQELLRGGIAVTAGFHYRANHIVRKSHHSTR